MAESSETLLRNSLDAVERGRRWAVLGVVALVVGTAIGVASLFATAAAARGGSDAGVSKALFVATTTQMLFTGICAVVVMFHVSRTTTMLLRAMALRDR
jgi:hypothetical protein